MCLYCGKTQNAEMTAIQVAEYLIADGMYVSTSGTYNPQKRSANGCVGFEGSGRASALICGMSDNAYSQTVPFLCDYISTGADATTDTYMSVDNASDVITRIIVMKTIA